MRYSIVIYCCFIFYALGCNSTTDSSKIDNRFRIELTELEFVEKNNIETALGNLDSAYVFFSLQNDSEINILYVTKTADSVLFNFSIFPKDCIWLFFEEHTDLKVFGYLDNNNNDLLVFDQVGIFESKKVVRSFDFGYQEKEYPLLFEPPLYRYYLNNKNQLDFVLESWFINYY